MIILNGNWKSGYAFDIHSYNSIFLGRNEYNHPIYDTSRSDMGDALYRLKYLHDQNQISTILNLLTKSEDFIRFIQDKDAILPIPPTKQRKIQPVFETAKQLADKFEKKFLDNVLLSTNTQQIKNMPTAEKYKCIYTTAYIDFSRLDRNTHYLIVDDLYDSGTTLKAYVDKFIQNGYNDVSVFTLTKSRISD